MKIDKEEVLRYLGYRNQEVDKNIEDVINQCILEIEDLTKGKYIYKLFDLKKTPGMVSLEKSTLTFTSLDIIAHLKYSSKCVLMAVTLGLEVEKRISFYSKLDLTRAVILDACASAFVEALCDQVEREIEIVGKQQGLHITKRYSPGYGDFPLEVQPEIINVLNAYQKIGLSATKNSLLIPRKSVTAIIGLQKEPINYSAGKCKQCPNLDCLYRKEGKDCVKTN